MALTPYTPADALPDLVGGSGGPIQLHQDGDVPTHDTLMQSSSADRGVIGKLLNGLYYVSRRTLGSYGGTRTLATLAELASQAVGSEGAKLVGVGGSVGAAMTLPTGTLQALADWLADHVPALTTLGAVDGETLIGVDDYAGTNWTITAGTLRTFLRALADHSVRTDVVNTFAAAVVTAVGTYTSRAPSRILATATSANIGCSAALWFAETWNGAGGTLALTLVDPPTADKPNEPEIEVLFLPTSNAAAVTFTRATGSTLLGTLTSNGSVRFKWSSTTNLWRVMGVTLIDQASGSWVFATA
jgi:hypothetical protein